MDENSKNVYLQVGSIRLYDVIVNLDNELIYKGNIEDAPEDIKQLKYSKISIGDVIVCDVYSENQ